MTNLNVFTFSLSLLIVSGYVTSEHYYIVPSGSTTSCLNHSNRTCFTLSEFASKSSHLDKDEPLTLSFFPGEHILTSRIRIKHTQNVTLTAQNTSDNSTYTIKCLGTSGFEFGDIEYFFSIEYLKFMGCGNVDYGGAISVHIVKFISIRGCHFIGNNAIREGGAVYVKYMESMVIANSVFNNNHITHSAPGDAVYGGGVSANFGSIFTINSYYMNNDGYNGGAISAYVGSIYTESDYYINNSAGYSGGALYTQWGNVYSQYSHYINNSVGNAGGAMNCFFGNILSMHDQYLNNRATSGSAIQINSGHCKLYNDTFTGNTAEYIGAVLYKVGGMLEISHCNITDNYVSDNSIFFLDNGTLIVGDGVNFVNNQGSLYISNTQVQFNGQAMFVNNSAELGGGIKAIQSQILFKKGSKINIRNNKAAYGGGVYLAKSSWLVSETFELTGNTAGEYGGGIYAFQSDIEFDLEIPNTVHITDNAALNGGAVCAVTSTIKISNTYVKLDSNIAVLNGGAMYLGQNTKIHLLKNEPDYVGMANLHVRLDFINNSAERGGGVYVTENANDGVLCHGPKSETNQAECFIQTLSSYNSIKLGIDIIFINTYFINNTAHQSGSDIYGGQLDRCTVNPSSELGLFNKVYTISDAFDYIKVTTQLEHIIDYSDYARSHPDYLVSVISKTDVMGLISSNGHLAFCVDGTDNFNPSSVLLRKGELFNFPVVVIDQVGNLINATVSSTLTSESGNGHFKGGQVVQQVRNQCTELEYNVYSQDNSAKMQVQLFTEGPCTIEVSSLTLNLHFLPCECPAGFQPSSSLTECICECDQRLKQYQITSCFAINGTIQLNTNIWIGVTNSTNSTGFIIHDCPFDYCVKKPVNISLISPDNADKQCAYNRTGSLCGMCKNFSLVLGSSRCKQCSNYYLSLLIPFALAGIALVAFILFLNLTVATGTIHGLIFYANILTANQSMFLPFATSSSTFLTVFISWLNLDLGIETCFYDGMDSYGKFLIQLAFPAYMFVLIAAIIVLCEVSEKFATLLANRNPVAALCTLILLSYSKLIRTIITALQFTYLYYPDGSQETVWLYDANVPYFTISHIPRFIAAFIIIIVGAVYTILLLFGQWFPRCSNRKIMRWVKNTKYNAFIDAYHAPFTPTHRYWMGLLLFAITTHDIVASLTGDSPASIISAGSAAVGLILLKLLNTRIYKNRLQDSLETLFLINIVVLTVATREMEENQYALANTSMTISFALFVGILCYHSYKYILRGSRSWIGVEKKLKQLVKFCVNNRELDVLPPVEYDELHDELEDERDELDREMQPPYTDDNNTDPDNPPPLYDPPVIVPAVRYDQPREPALDILDPITTDDYRQVNQRPAPRPQQVPTTTVIDFVRPRRIV